MRVRLKDGQQQTTVIRMAVNCAARAMNCHLTNTRVMSVASARIAATVRSRLCCVCISGLVFNSGSERVQNRTRRKPD